MRKIIRNIFLFALSASGLYKILRYKNRKNPLVLVYHDILSSDMEYTVGGTSLSLEMFQKQIDYLAKRYTFISIYDFLNWKLQGYSLPSNPLLITFDDGHQNIYPALRYLSTRGIKAGIFVKTDAIGTVSENYFERLNNLILSAPEEDFTHKGLLLTKNKEKFSSKLYNYFRKLNFEEQNDFIMEVEKQFPHADDFVPEEKYLHLSESAYNELISMGHSLQSHSVHHYMLSSLTDKDSLQEINESKICIEKKFGVDVIAFAYPFGDPRHDYGEREIDYVKQSGYQLAFSGEHMDGQFVKVDCDNFDIPRFGDVGFDFLYFKMLLSGFRLRF